MKLHINWNVLGVSAAVVCAIHCALLPLFITSLPLLGISFLHNIYFEAGMIFLAIIIGGISLWHGYNRHHHKLLPLSLFLAGMIILIVNKLLDDFSVWLIIPSTILILLGYYLNWKLCRLAKHCHASDCNH